MPKKDLSHIPPHLRQTYVTDKVAVPEAVARLTALAARGDDSDTSWANDLPNGDEALPVDDSNACVTNFPRKREEL